MSQGMWIKGPVCGVENCRSRLWRSNAGQKFCQYGHVMEGNIEIDDDDGESYTQTKRLNIQISDTGHASRYSTPITSGPGSKADSRLYGEEGRVYHWACLQRLIQGITSRTVRHLYGYLLPDTLEVFSSRVSRATKLLWMRCVRVSQSESSPVVLDLFAIVYLALRQVNQYPVYLDDYMLMMKNNKVPLLNASSLLSPEMLKKCPMRTFASLRVKAIPMANRFIKLIQQWTFRLGIHEMDAFPMHDFYPLVFKTFRSLRLPHAPSLLAQYHELCTDTTGGFLVLRNSTFSPELRCVAMMFYILRLYFHESPTIPDPSPWKTWLSNQVPAEFPYDNESFQSMSSETLLDLSDNQVLKYSDWVYELLVPERLKTDGEGLSIMERKIHQIFKYTREKVQPETQSTAESDFTSVTNSLTHTEKLDMEKTLVAHFVSRFGIQARTLRTMTAKIQRELYVRMKKRGLLIPLLPTAWPRSSVQADT